MSNFIDTITVQDFKNYFTRGFIYANIWNNSDTYNKGDIVYYNLTDSYYQCLNNNVVSIPTTTNDWSLLPTKGYILDDDITKAFLQAKGSFDITFYNNQDIAKMVFLYLTAHYLCIDFNLQGLQIGGSQGYLTGRRVDDVALEYGVPTKITSNIIYAHFFKTGYGAKALVYIHSNSIPKMYGIVSGKTTP